MQTTITRAATLFTLLAMASVALAPWTAEARSRAGRPGPGAAAGQKSPGRPWITRSLGITRGQRKALNKGDLSRFWRSRLGQDPVARIGIALWGSEKDLRRAIQSQHAGYWQPKPGLLARAALRVKAPGKVRTKPRSQADLLAYWRWLGEETRGRVLAALEKRDRRRGAGDPQSRQAEVRAIGRALARAHAGAVAEDHRAGRGTTPGLLTPRQVMAYHHDVFAGFGLPRSTYGGTPMPLVPNGLQLWAASGIYAHDAER